MLFFINVWWLWTYATYRFNKKSKTNYHRVVCKLFERSKIRSLWHLLSLLTYPFWRHWDFNLFTTECFTSFHYIFQPHEIQKKERSKLFSAILKPVWFGNLPSFSLKHHLQVDHFFILFTCLLEGGRGDIVWGKDFNHSRKGTGGASHGID